MLYLKQHIPLFLVLLLGGKDDLPSHHHGGQAMFVCFFRLHRADVTAIF